MNTELRSAPFWRKKKNSVNQFRTLTLLMPVVYKCEK